MACLSSRRRCRRRGAPADRQPRQRTPARSPARGLRRQPRSHDAALSTSRGSSSPTCRRATLPVGKVSVKMEATTATVERYRVTDGALLDAATAVFAAEGFDRSTMEAIALRGGVTKPTLYARFG